MVDSPPSEFLAHLLQRKASSRTRPAVLDRGLQLQVITQTASRAVDTDGVEHRSAEAMHPLGSELLWSKLWPPVPRAGLVPRASLQSLLQAGLQAKLCLLSAPAGFGKTTLLTQWCAVAGAGRVAWVSLDEGEDDPTRFWLYAVEALRTVEPSVGAAALAALQRTSADLYRAVLPSLHSELRAVGSPLVLVLDDYHLVTNATCHQTLGFFLDHLPASVHVALSTRADPPLPLARMRARGELAELRVAELQFTGEEASALLNGSMGLQLANEDVARLTERTEGWAAGLVLAGLSLRGREDASGFVASFYGDNRHIADDLGAEVLARQPEQVRRFLLRTSVLERLSGPLCDAVLQTQGSAALLDQLERSNLFLMPLDDRRGWYRYHQLFGELLRLELGRRVSAAEQPYAVVTALAVLSLIAGDEGCDRTAAARAGHAAALAEAHGLSAEPLCGIVHMAVGQALMLHGKLTEAEEQLGRALELLGIDSMLVQRAHALLLLASVRQGHGNLPGARALVEQARELLERLADPGSLPALVEQANRNLGSASRRQVEAATPLTKRERAVLRLLPTRLSNREIGRELYVSVNTVRSQVRAIYRKLEVTSRAEAVAHARHLRLLPGSTPTDR